MSENLHSTEKISHGEDVEITVSLRRHAEKKQGSTLAETTSADMPLSQAGKEASDSLGEEVNAKGNAKVYYSPAGRTEETGKRIAAGQRDTPDIRLYHPRPRSTLHFRTYSSEEDDRKLAEQLHREGKSETDMVQMMLEMDDLSADISRSLAREILHVLDMSKKMRSHARVHMEFISHSGILENFLKDILKKEAADFIEKEMGGNRFNYLEDMKFTIHRINKKEAKIKFSFRGQEVDILENELRNLASTKKMESDNGTVKIVPKP